MAEPMIALEPRNPDIVPGKSNSLTVSISAISSLGPPGASGATIIVSALCFPDGGERKPGTTYLFMSTGEKVQVLCDPSTLTATSKTKDSPPTKVWEISAGDLDSVKITISGFKAVPGPGEATLTVRIVYGDKPIRFSKDITVTVNHAKPDPSGIHSFDVWPDYLLHGGED